jgi:hypothetical protein
VSMDTKNPHTAEPVKVFATQAEWEQERDRREARAALEWSCFAAWWEAYKRAMEVADGVEREYRARRIEVHDAIEKIWSGFPDVDCLSRREAP